MTASGSQILCIGAAHWDIIGRSEANLGIGGDVPGKIERRIGGVASNIATGLAARGCPTGLCSVVGGDEAGVALIRDLEASGVDCSSIRKIEGANTDLYLAIEDERGDLFAAIADASLLERNADTIVNSVRAVIQNTRTVVLDANLSPSALRQIAEMASNAGAEIVANPASPAKASRIAFLLSCGFTPTVVGNLAEVNELLSQSHTNAHDAAAALQYQTQGVVLVTNGAHPLVLVTPKIAISASPPELPMNMSVTGAGDALLAAFLAARSTQAQPDSALRSALAGAVDHMKANSLQ